MNSWDFVPPQWLERLREDEEVREQTARMFYRLEGWEKYWPYEKRPEWLRRLKYL